MIPSTSSSTYARISLALGLSLLLGACADDPTQPSTPQIQLPPRVSPTMIDPLAVSPMSVTFDAQTVGTPGPTKAITVHNAGMTELTLTAIGVIGFHKEDFPLDTQPSQRCQVNVPIAPDASCEVYVAFVPSAAGPRYGELKLEHANGIMGVPFEGLGLSAVDLAVTMSGTVIATKTVSYHVTVRNDGPNDAPGVVITDALPITTAFVSIAGSQDIECQVPAAGGAGGAVVCSIPALKSGGSRELAITVKALPGSKNSISNTVTVTSALYDGVTTNNKATVTTSLNGKKQ